MKHDVYEDSYIYEVLKNTTSIGVVGASANVVRPSFIVAKYLNDKGYSVTPINPGQAGKEIEGMKAYASLEDMPHPVDMIDIFRNVSAVPGIVDEILALEWKPNTVWMQLTIRDDEQAKRLEEVGIQVVMNRCPKIEYARLSGEITWSGINSKRISAKKPKMGESVQSYKL